MLVSAMLMVTSIEAQRAKLEHHPPRLRLVEFACCRETLYPSTAETDLAWSLARHMALGWDH